VCIASHGSVGYRVVDGSFAPLRFSFLFVFLPQASQPLSIALGVAVLEKARMAFMGGADAAGMLDRASVLLRARSDLAHIASQAIGVGTVKAIHSFNGVEVGQIGAVEDEELRAPDPGDPVDRETGALIDPEKQVEQEERDKPGNRSPAPSGC
jgi:hypothetical protein